MVKMQFKVPNRINRNIKKLIKKINIESKTEYITVETEILSDNEDCFMNVKNKIKRDGGDIKYGWQIVEDPFYLEAKYYCIWESPNGKLFDISPRSKGFKKTLFVHDRDNINTGINTRSIRINTSKNPLVDDFLIMFNTIESITNSYNIKNNIVVSSSSTNYNDLYHYLMKAKGFLSIMIISSESDLSMNCYCGSGISYEQCHRPELLHICSDIID
ncbi:MAG: hypothetical protein OCD02_13290 [Spirochaetaceae bacterium]